MHLFRFGYIPKVSFAVCTPSSSYGKIFSLMLTNSWPYPEVGGAYIRNGAMANFDSFLSDVSRNNLDRLSCRKTSRFSNDSKHAWRFCNKFSLIVNHSGSRQTDPILCAPCKGKCNWDIFNPPTRSIHSLSIETKNVPSSYLIFACRQIDFTHRVLDDFDLYCFFNVFY